MMAEEPITLSVSPIHAGEENDGPLQSTDLFVKGPDISLLINICVGNTLTYSGTLSGIKRHGTIHLVTQADPPETRIPSAWTEFGDGHDYSRTGKHDPIQCRLCQAAEITRLTQERDASRKANDSLAASHRSALANAFAAIEAERRTLERAEQAERRERRLKSALKNCHQVLEAADAVIDPEAHPEVQALIDALFLPCDEADECPTLPKELS